MEYFGDEQIEMGIFNETFFFEWILNKIWIIHILLSIRRAFSRVLLLFWYRISIFLFVGLCCCRVPVGGFMIFNISTASFYLTRCVWMCVFCIRNHFLWFSSSFFIFLSRSLHATCNCFFMNFIFWYGPFWILGFCFFMSGMCINYGRQHDLQKKRRN